VSKYDIVAMHMDPVPGWHGGTASLTRRQLVVDPNSVPGVANLKFLPIDVHVTTLLYQINQQVVPNWFGVAVPDGVTDFTKLNLFFHPIPGQDGYDDNFYFSKTGPPGGSQWYHLFYYMELLGYQVDGAITNFGAPGSQIIIMPFMTSNRTDAGILPADWQGILTDILTDVRQVIGGSRSGPVSISEVVVSSFSVGYVYSENFRNNAAGPKAPILRQVWDFDGYPKSDSSNLITTSQVTAVKYDQGSEPGCFHVPLARWNDYPKSPQDPADPAKPASSNDVHGAIRDFMFLDAATRR
jgi:hypothetical protein